MLFTYKGITCNTYNHHEYDKLRELIDELQRRRSEMAYVRGMRSYSGNLSVWFTDQLGTGVFKGTEICGSAAMSLSAMFSNFFGRISIRAPARSQFTKGLTMALRKCIR